LYEKVFKKVDGDADGFLAGQELSSFAQTFEEEGVNDEA